MDTINLDAVLKLPVSERIRLAEAVWDCVVQEAADVGLHHWQALELDRRLADFVRSPTEGRPWGEVKPWLTRCQVSSCPF